VNLDALDASDLYGYGHPLPDGAAMVLLEAAHEHRIAMAPAAQDEIEKCLYGLRSATLVRDEDAKEARATMSLLRAHLADVPLDVLQDACRSYCNAPGRRYFPKSAGELRSFINPLMLARAARAYRLERLAKKASEDQAERDRIAADPVTPEGIAAVMAEFGLPRSSSHSPSTASPRPEPTIADYVALGLTEDEARQAMADRERMLRRSPAKPFASAASSALNEAAKAA